MTAPKMSGLEMQLPEILAWLTAATIPIHCYGVFKILKYSLLRPSNRVLRQNSLLITFLAITVIIFVSAFINNSILSTPFLNTYQTQVITRSLILAMVIPVLYWLWLYR